jgi:hypothetical protein
VKDYHKTKVIQKDKAKPQSKAVSQIVVGSGSKGRGRPKRRDP